MLSSAPFSCRRLMGADPWVAMLPGQVYVLCIVCSSGIATHSARVDQHETDQAQVWQRSSLITERSSTVNTMLHATCTMRYPARQRPGALAFEFEPEPTRRPVTFYHGDMPRHQQRYLACTACVLLLLQLLDRGR
jgi:hypothetical protein